METKEIIVLVLFAVLLVGSVLAIFLMSRRYERAKDVLQDRLADLGAEKSALESRLAAREAFEQERKEAAKAARLEEQAAREKERQEMERRHARELEALRDSFKALAAENSDAFRQKSEKTISELMAPVQEKFREFSTAVKESQDKSAERHTRLEERIRALDSRSKAVGDEARNLANALTGYSKVQGDFGEMLLTDVLKNAGLTEGVHFVTQGVMTDAAGHEIKSDSGRTMIPDVMVFYPDDTTVIIDSKVSLTAYSQYMAAETVDERRKAARLHVDSVRAHVEELRAKDYASYIPEGRRKVGYNIMFVPIEGAFRLMLEEDPRLWQLAKDNNVLIVSQMTLIIVLNMIQMSWKQYDQQKNIADVYRTAEELMSQIRGWLESFVAVGTGLEKASAAYAESKKKLQDSNQSVLKKIGKLEALGLAPKRSHAKLRTGARLSGPESVIPKELSDPE